MAQSSLGINRYAALRGETDGSAVGHNEVYMDNGFTRISLLNGEQWRVSTVNGKPALQQLSKDGTWENGTATLLLGHMREFDKNLLEQNPKLVALLNDCARGQQAEARDVEAAHVRRVTSGYFGPGLG